MKRLTLYNNEQQDVPKDSLLDFCKKFPILFEALEAKFALMPSSTRIVKQKHGQLRECLRDCVGQAYTDAEQQYITNMEY